MTLEQIAMIVGMDRIEFQSVIMAKNKEIADLKAELDGLRPKEKGNGVQRGAVAKPDQPVGESVSGSGQSNP